MWKGPGLVLDVSADKIEKFSFDPCKYLLFICIILDSLEVDTCICFSFSEKLGVRFCRKL